MIASHDSLTYLPARRRWLECLSFAWRTQGLSIAEQLEAGVRYFDVRVRWDKKTQSYRVCHGVVDFDRTFRTIEEIITLFAPNLVRIILERGDTSGFERDAERIAIQRASGLYGNLHLLAVKHPWRQLYRSSYVTDPETGTAIESPGTVDHTYVPWDTGKTIWENLRAFKLSTIKAWARKNPPQPCHLKDSETVHFFDWING
ncbi:MAG: hypothetical protein HDS82_06660 [Bacteroidales bacterium]|nr:hypothetical protein [Bacteroidales bacterium]